MTYPVKYRDKSGDIVELELDVPNKNAVWPELKKARHFGVVGS